MRTPSDPNDSNNSNVPNGSNVPPPRLLLGLSVLLLFVSLWIVVPAPNMALLPLGVGAPELSPLLLGASVLLAGVAFRRRDGAVRGAAACLAVITTILCAMPLARFPFAVRRFDAAMIEAGVPIAG